MSAGRRWVTFMTRGAKSSLSRWRCAETVVTPSLGYSRVPGPDRQPVALGATVDAFTGVRRAAAGGGESAPRGCVWALCCAPGTVTGRSFLISDSSFGVVARIVPIVALFAPARTPLRVTLAAKGSEGTKDRRSRYEGKQVKTCASSVARIARPAHREGSAGGN